VRPFALDENYRITADGSASFSLEKQRRNKAGDPIERWDIEGYFSDVSYACRAWARKVVLESDEELPAAIRSATAGLERALALLSALDFEKAAGQPVRSVGGG
jgi:hypothetical protein